MKGDSITVHILSRVASQASENNSDVAKENATLLSRGRAIAHAGCRTTGWQMPKAREPRDCGHHSLVIVRCSVHQIDA